ncbi:ABC transporter ATP-binding protein [Desulfocurvibacter africanus]|uniref:ABC transporter ATP-binding protein n=1 Tax=Desulfocurvibacter africanus TaxID=873 RepID=UPI002FD89C4F
MFLNLERVSKSFGDKMVLDDVSFDVAAGELVSIVGPSGVGKTTLLSIIAGLEQPDSGCVRFSVPPSRDNPAILVFQDYLLFPHMNLADNVAFGLRARRVGRKEAKQRAVRMLDFFGLVDKAGAYPVQLSAGQKQRAAIARALVVEPAVLLLDEPFANLDRNLKMGTARFIRETQKAFGITMLSVTHDLEEAFAMSDRMGIMLGGRIVRHGTPADIYHRPGSQEAAGFLGPVNRVPHDLLPLLCPGQPSVGPGESFFRPEVLRVRPDAQGLAIVETVTFAGHYIIYGIRLAEHAFTVYGQNNGIVPGDRVRLELDPAHAACETKESPQ